MKMKKAADTRLKKNDRILIAVLLVAAMLSYFGVRQHQSRTTNAGVAVVTAYGEVIGRYSLDQELEKKLPFEDGGYNTLVVSDGSAQITDASCPDKICVSHAPISKNGEMIVCLPHQLLVQIENGAESAADGIAE